jgi:hypothetical protein
MATPSPAEDSAGADRETVGDLAGLYLGNILYALEACARGFDAEGKADNAAFYRGIGRKLADARGREKAGG